MTNEDRQPQRQSSHLGSDDLADLEEQFDECDSDGDERIDLTEFSQLLGKLGSNVSPLKHRAQFDEVDLDRDGAIVRGEFLRWWRTR